MHTDVEIEARVREVGGTALKANAGIGDIAVGGGQTNFEHSLR